VAGLIGPEFSRQEAIDRLFVTAEVNGLIDVKAEKDGKLRVTSHLWTDPQIFLPGQDLVVRWVDGQAHIFRGTRELPPPAAPDPGEDDFEGAEA
jgi:hypothetical protein